MQALILGDDHSRQSRLAAALMAVGFQVICVESAGAAASYVRAQPIDVLIVTETRSVGVGQSCACISYSQNRQVSVLVVTDRTGPATDELFEQVPQLYAVVGFEMAPGIIAGLAQASILPRAPQQPAPQSSAMSQAAFDPAALAVANPFAMSPAPLSVALPEKVASAPALNAAAVQDLADPDSAANPVAAGVRPSGAAPLARTLIQPAQRPGHPKPGLADRTVSHARSALPGPMQAGPVTSGVLADMPPVGGARMPSGLAQRLAARSGLATATAGGDLRTGPGTPGVAASPASPAIGAAPVAATQSASQTSVAAAHQSDTAADLAALERAFDLVRQDRPTVAALPLGPAAAPAGPLGDAGTGFSGAQLGQGAVTVGGEPMTIADVLPGWSRFAPKLAQLTDGAQTTSPLPATALPILASSAPTGPAAPASQIASGASAVRIERRLALGTPLQ